jgi:hypothetical protein
MMRSVKLQTTKAIVPTPNAVTRLDDAGLRFAERLSKRRRSE